MNPLKQGTMLAGPVLLAALMSGCGGGGGGGNGSETAGVAADAVAQASSRLGSPAIPQPASGAYFGAWANPQGIKGPTAAEVESATETLESQIGRKLSLHMHYFPWRSGSAPAFPDETMQFDLKAGRTPVVTWACGDSNANVAAGNDDPLIIATAQAVKQFGAPMFIRWYWEMNLPAGTNNQDCMGESGAKGYIAAWKHIHDVFKAQGVTNVSWLWNPAGSSRNADSLPYYPGDDYVDWIGFDGYDKVGANDFGPILDSFYIEFNSHDKPMLIAETGECAAVQSAYLALAQAEIEGKPNPGGYSFPLVKGFMYFDAPGHYAPCTWNFGADGTAAFAAMGADSFFQPVP
ncbi:glycoside hydrolase family 26 protein [Trinickia dinghuensis]|uniref:GH26 domain-containing protein n=1 Tax=Trinickia dinghuensis TaxID=2291023 RepID=A0A3D8K122_9BURK|nr:glycosyl hydrolase [Trinickia dinghuensis]RDU98616.1 hypothetical protein DWV00_10015 [Trinickia dinghuensis]